MRRAAAEQLLQQQQQHTYADQLATTPVLPELLAAAAATADNNASASSSSSTSSSSHLEPQPPPQPQGSVTSCSPAIRVLCRTPDQVSAALAIPWLSEVIVEFLEVHGLREAVAAVRGAGKQVRVFLARRRVACCDCPLFALVAVLLCCGSFAIVACSLDNSLLFFLLSKTAAGPCPCLLAVQWWLQVVGVRQP